MENPIQKIKESLKTEIQKAINALGKDFYKTTTLKLTEDEYLSWDSFGYEYGSWLQVSKYVKVGSALDWQWACVATTVIDQGSLDLSAYASAFATDKATT